MGNPIAWRYRAPRYFIFNISQTLRCGRYRQIENVTSPARHTQQFIMRVTLGRIAIIWCLVCMRSRVFSAFLWNEKGRSTVFRNHVLCSRLPAPSDRKYFSCLVSTLNVVPSVRTIDARFVRGLILANNWIEVAGRHNSIDQSNCMFGRGTIAISTSECLKRFKAGPGGVPGRRCINLGSRCWR